MNELEITTPTVAAHGIKASALKIKKGSVVKENTIPGEVAERLFRKFTTYLGDTSADDREETRVRLAVSLASGTSAETDFSKRYLDAEDPDTSLSALVAVLTAEDSPLCGVTNHVRVFARSLPHFADLTRDVIRANPWLAHERAMDYELDVKYAGVCFDYADHIDSASITPMEKSVLAFGLRKKGREGRSFMLTGENGGAKGSDPVSRGVGSNVAPDAGRVGVATARGVGPYA